MVHKYKLMGLNIVMDIYSGAVHIVDDCFYDIMDVIGGEFDKTADYSEKLVPLKTKYSEKEVAESFAELKKL